jgi:hypothetical protein
MTREVATVEIEIELAAVRDLPWRANPLQAIATLGHVVTREAEDAVRAVCTDITAQMLIESGATNEELSLILALLEPKGAPGRSPAPEPPES